MAGCVYGIRGALVLGLVLIAGAAIEQAPSVGPRSMNVNYVINKFIDFYADIFIFS